jgi:hypothetical protein
MHVAGARHALDVSPERWQCAIHCCDAVFYTERKQMSVAFTHSARAHGILEQLSAVIEQGYALAALQSSPHLTLLNEEWYERSMKPVVAQWMLLFLEANHVSGLKTEHMVAYISNDGTPLIGTAWDAAVEEAAAAKAQATTSGESPGSRPAKKPSEGSGTHALRRLYALIDLKLAAKELSAKAMQLLNLCADWLSTYLPHCLSKLDRVSFGLLSMKEIKRLAVTEPHMPRSRLKLAIPFVGKDVPSAASEFAHPDIIIGLTVLAHRYEGLRRTDFEQDLIALLRSNFEQESGPYRLRKSSLMYNGTPSARTCHALARGCGRHRSSRPRLPAPQTGCCRRAAESKVRQRPTVPSRRRRRRRRTWLCLCGC